jgi:xanthine dehydrogenase accessory factor
MTNEATTLYLDAVREKRTAVLATVLEGSRQGTKVARTLAGASAGTLGSDEIDSALHPHLLDALNRQESTRIALEIGDETLDIFLDVTAPPPRLIIVGAVHAAIALVTFGNTLGYETIVLDNRTAFATPERLGHAAHLIVAWPADALEGLAIDDGCYLVFLTHDPKIDNPALVVALNSPARYIGALGSRKTHAKRLVSLHEEGVSEALTQRIHAPVGLDIGARSPEEIALSIIAEITAVRRGRTP